MRDTGLIFLGYFLGAVVAPWLRRRRWFDAMTTRLARGIDRVMTMGTSR